MSLVVDEIPRDAKLADWQYDEILPFYLSIKLIKYFIHQIIWSTKAIESMHQICICLSIRNITKQRNWFGCSAQNTDGAGSHRIHWLIFRSDVQIFVLIGVQLEFHFSQLIPLYIIQTACSYEIIHKVHDSGGYTCIMWSRNRTTKRDKARPVAKTVWPNWNIR